VYVLVALVSLALTSPFSSPRGVSQSVWTEIIDCPGPVKIGNKDI